MTGYTTHRWIRTTPVNGTQFVQYALNIYVIAHRVRQRSYFQRVCMVITHTHIFKYCYYDETATEMVQRGPLNTHFKGKLGILNSLFVC